MRGKGEKNYGTIMEDKLKILMLEDVPSDAELIEHALHKADIDVESRRVENREAFIAALGEFSPDVVLLDYKLPGFNGREALGVVRETHPEIPAIMVTGALSDEAAIELLKAFCVARVCPRPSGFAAAANASAVDNFTGL